MYRAIIFYMNEVYLKKSAAGLSIVSNAAIIVLKVIAGVISGSISIISEAIHSFSDLLASILTMFAVSRSSEPADKEHPFGHGKYEDMSGFIEGVLIVIAAFYIIIEAVKKLLTTHHLQIDETLGIWVMAIAVVVNFLVSAYLLFVAKKTNSISIYADAQHLRTDVYSSLGVLAGLVVIKVTNLTILDPVIAICVATIILKTGFAITKETLNNLLDGSLPNEDIEKVENILRNSKKIKGFKDLKTRKLGGDVEIEITLLFDEDISLLNCHDICDEIENSLRTTLKNARIITHAEPVLNKDKNHD